MGEEHKDGKDCCSTTSSGGSCCGKNKVLCKLVFALLIFALGFLFGKTCASGVCPFSGKSYSHSQMMDQSIQK